MSSSSRLSNLALCALLAAACGSSEEAATTGSSGVTPAATLSDPEYTELRAELAHLFSGAWENEDIDRAGELLGKWQPRSTQRCRAQESGRHPTPR